MYLQGEPGLPPRPGKRLDGRFRPRGAPRSGLAAGSSTAGGRRPPRRSTALARAATNAEHPQLGDPAGFRCCVTRTPRNRAERGDIGVFEGEAREEASLGSQERPLFGTGVVTPYPRTKTAALCRTGRGTGRLLTRCATTADAQAAQAAQAARLVARTVVDPRTPSTTPDTSPPSVQDP